MDILVGVGCVAMVTGILSAINILQKCVDTINHKCIILYMGGNNADR